MTADIGMLLGPLTQENDAYLTGLTETVAAVKARLSDDTPHPAPHRLLIDLDPQGNATGTFGMG